MNQAQDNESEVQLISLNIMDECKLGLKDTSIDIFSKLQIANTDKLSGDTLTISANFNHPSLNGKKWEIATSELSEMGSLSLDNLKIDIESDYLEVIQERISVTCGIQVHDEDLIIESQSSTFELVPPLELQIEYTKVYSYVFQQNQFPLVSLIKLTNNCTEPVEALSIFASIDPPDFKEITWVVDQIPAKYTTELPPQDFKIPASSLENLIEQKEYSLTFTVKVANEEIVSLNKSFSLLPKNHWGGEIHMPELLAAFVNPNHPYVQNILKKAVNLLAETSQNYALDGYKSLDKSKPYMVGASLWSTIYKEGISYATPPPSFASSGQKIRMPEEIKKTKFATCLDSALLFASCLEAAGLNPILVLMKEHAFVGYWLIDKTFQYVTCNDATDIRNSIALDDLKLFETTFVTSGGNIQFNQAIEDANRKLSEHNEADFVYAIDLRQARDRSIRPIHMEPISQTPDSDPTKRESIPLPPPPVFDDVIDFKIDLDPSTPEARVQQWLSRLLDLSGKNRLLNIQKNSVGFKVLCPEIDKLEDALIGGNKYKFVSSDLSPTAGGERSSVIFKSNTGEDINDTFVKNQLLSNNLVAECSKEVLERHLINLLRKSIRDLEEGGANTLFLSLGLLKWKKSANAKNIYRAPLILLPVKLHRTSANTQPKLEHLSDEETVFNPTLIQFLKEDYEIDLSQFEESLPKDHSGVDVAKIWRIVRQKIQDTPGFEVVEELFLSNFSFAKYLMWKDLRDREEQLKESNLVKHLIENPLEFYPHTGEFIEPSEIDKNIKAKDLFAPLNADSSQIAAIEASTRNIDFVLEGPPGTGKTETIGNIIAQNLALGKKVLFIAEKMVALEQVYDRLKGVGLGHLCLELHSNKSSKTHVIKQLEESWEVRKIQNTEQWEENAKKLEDYKNILNNYVSALHEKSKFGITPYQAISRTVFRSEKCRLKLNWNQYRSLDSAPIQDKKQLDEIINFAVASGRAFRDLSKVNVNGLKLVKNEDWTTFLQTDLEAASSSIIDNAVQLKNLFSELKKELGVDYLELVKISDLSLWDEFCVQLLSINETKLRIPFEKNADDLIEQLSELANLKTRLQALAKSFNESLDYEKLQNIKIEDWSSAINDLDRQSRFYDRFDYVEKIKDYISDCGLPSKFSKSQDNQNKANDIQNRIPELKKLLQIKIQDLKFVGLDSSKWIEQLSDLHSFSQKNVSAIYKIKDEVNALGIGPKSHLVEWKHAETSDLAANYQKIKKTLRYNGSHNDVLKLPIQRWVNLLDECRNKNFFSSFLTKRKLKKEMDGFGIKPAKDFTNLPLFGDLQKSLHQCMHKSLRILLENISELQTLLLENQKLDFLDLINGLKNSQDCLLQINELLKQYPNDQVIDYSETGTEEILQKQQLARSANNCLKNLCTRFENPDESLSILRAKLLSDINSIAQSKLIQTSLSFHEKISKFHGLIEEFCKLSKWEKDFSIGLDNLTETLKSLNGALPDLRPWCRWQSAKKSAIENGFPEIVYALEEGLTFWDTVGEDFKTAFCVWLSNILINESAPLRKFSSDHEEKIKEFRILDKKVASTTGQYVAAKLSGNVVKTREPDAPHEFGVLQRQISAQGGNKKHLLPVRKLVEEMGEHMLSLTPCFMMSPISVAQYLPTKYKLFDLVIFDEASQITVWDAVGSIARGKNVIVVGDPKQMPPTNFFERNQASQSAEDGFESILDHAMSTKMAHHRLTGHYRSKHESLILFSNSRYYSNSLITYPSSSTKESAVSFHKVNGVYSKGADKTNPIEAQAVVEEVVRRLNDPVLCKQSIGIVTFNSNQMQLVENLLDDERRKNSRLDKFFNESSSREPIFVKNLETVQGDQRDVIILSVGYGPTELGATTMHMNFGPLSQSGGERRLNVAITRAAKEMLVFASFEPSMIDLSRVSHQGVKDLKAYLDFARRGPVAIVEEAKFNPDADDFDSDFERSVAESLRRKNWEVKTQIGVSKFRIDLGVVNPDTPGLFLAGIECDGASYHSSPSARDRDRVRHLILEGLNWKLLRIWSTDYFANKIKIIDDIDRRLNELLDDYRQKIAEEKSKSEEESETDPNDGISQESEEEYSAEESANLPESEVQSEDNETINNQDLHEEDSDILEKPFVYYSGPPCKDPHKCDESEVKDRLLHIITDEGPMFVDCAYKTYLRSAGISKLGRQLRRILNKNLDALIRRGDIEEIKESDGEGFKGSVVRRRGTPAVILRATGNRKIEDIPPNEFRMLARKKYGKIPPPTPDFYRELIKFYGVSKLTSKSTEILDSIFRGL